jgi:hypothetical protein
LLVSSDFSKLELSADALDGGLLGVDDVPCAVAVRGRASAPANAMMLMNLLSMMIPFLGLG